MIAVRPRLEQWLPGFSPAPKRDNRRLCEGAGDDIEVLITPEESAEPGRDVAGEVVLAAQRWMLPRRTDVQRRTTVGGSTHTAEESDPHHADS